MPHNDADTIVFTSQSPDQYKNPRLLQVQCDSPTSNSDSSPWIGGTGLGSNGLGKSGRVIERLMAENDRLRREIKAEIAKREELQQAVQTQKPKIEKLQTENARLSNIKSMDDNIIARRDRKIDELRHEVELERQKRMAYEGRAREAERQRDEHEEASKKELQTANELARHASVHAEILQTSHQQLAREYRQRMATTNKAIRELVDEKEEDRRRVSRLDVVSNQMRQETERMRRTHGELCSLWQRYDDEKTKQADGIQADLDSLTQTACDNDVRNASLQNGMEEVIGRMRWVMRLDRLQKGHDVHSPPPSPPV